MISGEPLEILILKSKGSSSLKLQRSSLMTLKGQFLKNEQCTPTAAGLNPKILN